MNTNLKPEELNTFHDIGSKDKILHWEHIMNVNLCINKSHSYQICIVFEIPNIYLKDWIKMLIGIKRGRIEGFNQRTVQRRNKISDRILVNLSLE